MKQDKAGNLTTKDKELIDLIFNITQIRRSHMEQIEKSMNDELQPEYRLVYKDSTKS